MPSAYSNIVTTTVHDVPTTPVLSGVVSGQDVELSWTASTVGDSTIENYLLYRSTDGVTFSLYQTISGETTSYDDEDLASGDYWYYVIAEAATGTLSAASNTVEEEISSDSPSLSTFAIQAGNYFNGTITNRGYSDGSQDGEAFGALLSGGGVQCTLNAFTSAAAEINNLTMALIVTGESVAPAQDFFTSLQVTDNEGNTATLNSDGTATYANGSFLLLSYFTDGLTSFWEWIFESPTNRQPLTTDDDYTVTVS